MNIYTVRLITFSRLFAVRAFPMLPGQTLLSTRSANWKFLKTP